MGAGPSLAKFLKSMDDEDLIQMATEAYRLEPQRMEKIFTLAKLQHLDSKDAGETGGMTAFASYQRPTSSTPSAGPAAASSDNISVSPSFHLRSHPSAAMVPFDEMTHGTVDSLTNDQKDAMNALKSFEGHRLMELQPADRNPQNNANTQQHAHDATGVVTSSREVDEDGYPLLYGSCGRDKRYARCSVCYFRGLRCNSAHYCACCQRPVCIRPRKYPGEEHPKICWNVLHMDKDMIQRVEKKKKRKFQTNTAGCSPTTVANRMNPNSSRSRAVVQSGGVSSSERQKVINL